jgi:hypothetical protein
MYCGYVEETLGSYNQQYDINKWICTRLGDLSLGYGQVDIGKISRS